MRRNMDCRAALAMTRMLSRIVKSAITLKNRLAERVAHRQSLRASAPPALQASCKKPAPPAVRHCAAQRSASTPSANPCAVAERAPPDRPKPDFRQSGACAPRQCPVRSGRLGRSGAEAVGAGGGWAGSAMWAAPWRAAAERGSIAVMAVTVRLVAASAIHIKT